MPRVVLQIDTNLTVTDIRLHIYIYTQLPKPQTIIQFIAYECWIYECVCMYVRM